MITQYYFTMVRRPSSEFRREMYTPQKNSQEVEGNREHAISSNVEKMKTDMLKLLSTESIGGNADGVEIDGTFYMAAAANCYIRSGSAEIVSFTNYGPPEGEKDLKHGAFKLALSFDKGGFFHITEFIPGTQLSSEEQAVMDESVKRWNAWREKERGSYAA